jgi:ElaB/YqjD/DUF883 family membrane-anchored ribosome-binding protein
LDDLEADMSMDSGTGTSGTQVKDAAAGVAQSAKQEATQVASTAADSAKQVASEASTQVKAVAQQAKQQVSTLFDQTRGEVRQTAQQKGQQAATGLRTLSDQLRSLASGQPDQAGQLQHFVQDAQERVSSFANRLETQGPEVLLQDVTRFARQRPVVFLAIAAGAGFAAGRLVRAGAAAASDQKNDSASYGMSPYATTTGYETTTDAYGMPELETAVTGGDLSVLSTQGGVQSPTQHATPTPGFTGSAGTASTGGEF